MTQSFSLYNIGTILDDSLTTTAVLDADVDKAIDKLTASKIDGVLYRDTTGQHLIKLDSVESLLNNNLRAIIIAGREF